MAINLIASSAQKMQRTPLKNMGQRFKYLLVLDFEATCEKDVALKEQEIIEFPCVAVNTKTWKIEKTFHEYVKPRINPILTPFCTDLTGIMQDTIENESHFPTVFKNFCKWLETNNFTQNTEQSAFVTCGDWDLKVMLPNQCELDNLRVPDYLKQWINLKTIYCDATGYYPRSLKDMFANSKLQMEGNLHSGIYDCINIARIIELLGKKHQAHFDITSSLADIENSDK